MYNCTIRILSRSPTSVELSNLITILENIVQHTFSPNIGTKKKNGEWKYRFANEMDTYHSFYIISRMHLHTYYIHIYILYEIVRCWNIKLQRCDCQKKAGHCFWINQMKLYAKTRAYGKKGLNLVQRTDNNRWLLAFVRRRPRQRHTATNTTKAEMVMAMTTNGERIIINHCHL